MKEKTQHFKCYLLIPKLTRKTHTGARGGHFLGMLGGMEVVFCLAG